MNQLVHQILQIVYSIPNVLAQTADMEPTKSYGGLDSAGEKFRVWHSDGIMDARYLIAALAIVGGVLLVASSVRAYHHRDRRSRPLLVFMHLARVLPLSWSDQWLLWRIARFQQLPSPLTLMLSPATLRHHALTYAADLPGAARLSTMMRIRAIRLHLARN